MDVLNQDGYVCSCEGCSLYGCDVSCICCVGSVSDTAGETGAVSQSMRACEESSKQVQEKFTEKMKQNNV